MFNIDYLSDEDYYYYQIYYDDEENNFGLDYDYSFYNYYSINPQSKYVTQGYKCGNYFLNLFLENINSSSEENILGTYFKFYLQKNNFFRNEAFKLWRYNEYEIKELIQFNESQ